MDYDLQDGSALVIGTGCMPNCNFALINAHESKVRVLFVITFCYIWCVIV